MSARLGLPSGVSTGGSSASGCSVGVTFPSVFSSLSFFITGGGVSGFILLPGPPPANNLMIPGRPCLAASITTLINCAIGSENKPAAAAPRARTPKALNLKVSNANAALPPNSIDPILTRLDTILFCNSLNSF